MTVYLCKMTKPLLRQYFQEFTNDPDIFQDVNQFTPYVYRESDVEAYWERQQRLGREHLAVMREQEPIGEVILKNIDSKNRHCTLGIHMKNDSVKNQGYGTRAEILALKYAFCDLGMQTVFADALRKNKRSQHVLEKVGFQYLHSDALFHYYRCDQASWQQPKLQEASVDKPTKSQAL